MRCNNQAFDLRRPQSRKAILFCLAKARGKFDFVLFGIGVMSNHVHYMIRPARPADMPRLMHWPPAAIHRLTSNRFGWPLESTVREKVG